MCVCVVVFDLSLLLFLFLVVVLAPSYCLSRLVLAWSLQCPCLSLTDAMPDSTRTLARGLNPDRVFLPSTSSASPVPDFTDRAECSGDNGLNGTNS